jgi:hypothetical protein
VARDQRGEGFVGVIFRMLPQQHAVIRWLHSTVSVRSPAKAHNLFAPWEKRFTSSHKRSLRHILGTCRSQTIRSAAE